MFRTARPRTEARKLLEEHGLVDVYPTPVVQLAEKLGFSVVYFCPDDSTKDVSGAVNHETKKILVNQEQPPQRQLFTIAHEIGHVVLHQGMSKVDYRKDIENSGGDPKEVEANKFAADLLMDPFDFLKVFYRNFGDIERTARYFGVSPAAAKIRANALGA